MQEKSTTIQRHKPRGTDAYARDTPVGCFVLCVCMMCTHTGGGWWPGKKRFIFFQHENTASLSAAPRQANPGGEKKDKKTEKSTMRLQSVSMRHEGCAICCCCLLLLLLLLSCSSLRMFGSRTARTVFANYVI